MPVMSGLAHLVTMTVLLATPAASPHARPKQAQARPAAPKTFKARITNHCPRDVQAHFVVLRPNASTGELLQAVNGTPRERIAAQSSVIREMRPYERLIIPLKDGRVSGWFDSREEGEGGTIEIIDDCTGVMVTNGPAAE
jgi:hypothetical protein